MIKSTTENIVPYDEPVTAKAVEPLKRMGWLKPVSTLALLATLSHTGTVFAGPTFLPGFFDNDNQVVSTQKPDLMPLTSYRFELSDLADINSYLSTYSSAKSFVINLSQIVNRVYSSAVEKKINFIKDPDTGMPILEVVLLTGLPVDEQFVKLDRLLFTEIEKEGLTDGLKYVILSQG